MKTICLFAALLLGGTVHAQTTPATTSPTPSTSATAEPSPTAAPATAPKIKPIGAIDGRPLPATQQSQQDRVRNRQTVMDGQPSPQVQAEPRRRTPRTKTKKARPARTSEGTEPR